LRSDNLIQESIENLNGWLVRKNWKAYDPFDGLNARFIYPLTFDNHYLRIILQQSVRRFPLNVRPLLGIKMETGSKGMGFSALGYLNLYKATGNEEYLNHLKFCLDWLMDHPSKGYSGYAWGNHFSYEARGGRIPRGVPTIVWTALIGNIFFDAYEFLGDRDYFEVAKSSCRFILNDITQYREDDERVCLMYTPYIKEPVFAGCIHNSNVLGASLLARLYKHTGDVKALDIAKKAMNYTVSHQLPEGGWYYGEPEMFKWIDCFHTGYVLESIYGFTKATGILKYEDSLIKGYKYFIETFFDPSGLPRYYSHKTYPIDIQCASQGIQTLVNLREYNASSTDIARKVAHWTINNMQDKSGYFYYRKYPIITNKTPMFHWGQSTMLAALSRLYMAG